MIVGCVISTSRQSKSNSKAWKLGKIGTLLLSRMLSDYLLRLTRQPHFPDMVWASSKRIAITTQT